MCVFEYGYTLLEACVNQMETFLKSHVSAEITSEAENRLSIEEINKSETLFQ